MVLLMLQLCLPIALLAAALKDLPQGEVCLRESLLSRGGDWPPENAIALAADPVTRAHYKRL